MNFSNWRVACSEWNNFRNIKKWNHFNANIVSVEKVLRDVVRQSHANVLPLGGISTDKGQSVIMKNLPNLVQCRRYSRPLVTMSRSILFRSCRDSDPWSLFTDWNCNRACHYYHGITLDMSFSNCFWSRWLIIDFLRSKMNKYFLPQDPISYRRGHKLYSFWDDFWCDMFC